MAEQDNELAGLREQNEDLVGYIQDYQGRLVEADFKTVQANNSARKLSARLTAAQGELDAAHQRIAELEAEAKPAKAPAAGK